MRLNVAAPTDFKGKLEGEPATGMVRVTDAHPAGTYAITVKSFDAGGALTTSTFTLTVTTPVTCTPVSFAAPLPAGVGMEPGSVAVGDFDRDGKQDLAVANGASNNVSILIGNGAGGFNLNDNYAVGNAPRSVAVGDFNGDGKEDLAVASQFSNNVSVLLGNGAGGFGSNASFGAGHPTFAVAVGDFNNDGKQDLVVVHTNLNSDNVSILIGDGMGGFNLHASFDAGDLPIFVAVGDFNNNGIEDLAVANLNSNNVSVLLGDGAGNFGTPANFGVGANPESVVVGDFDGDGIQDLATANFAVSSGTVWVLRGKGDGDFNPAVSYPVGSAPLEVAVGDFNGDGKQDLAVANLNSNNISILLGNGAGVFDPPANFAAGINPRFLAVGDFDGDGLQDLAATNLNSASVSVLLRQCVAQPGEVVISEFRLRGPNGANDEFVELHNRTNSVVTVADAHPTGTGDGWALVSADDPATPKFVIPAGTTIPARGHYLIANSTGYSLGLYPAGNVGGNPPAATPDGSYNVAEIPDNRGIAIFRTAHAPYTSTADRLDAVGAASETAPVSAPYREGTGYPDIAANPLQYSWVRRLPGGCTGSVPGFVNHNCTDTTTVATTPASPSGIPQDTDHNVNDFIYVETNGAATPVNNQRLGSPGPENKSSPIVTGNIKTSAIDPCLPPHVPPNRVRTVTSDPSNASSFGTLDIRRRFINASSGPVTRLRFRIVDMTTYPVVIGSGIADLRARTSTDLTVPVTCSGVTSVRGTTLETPPTPPAAASGGFNATLSADTVTPLTPLAPGESLNVRFLLGIQQEGYFRFLVIIEALP
jgi:hypothetical protein